MKQEAPRLSDEEMYQLLRDGRIDEFNAKRAEGKECDLRGVNLRGLDLRGMDVEGIDFSDSYFRGTDLRGLNMSTCRLEGTSIRNAKVSGTLFPKELGPEEIRLSLDHGTRIRCKG
jgi:uncharacterized protein YjbI with pentapeptide repeats